MHDQQFSGKMAFVTGASSGIGRAIAEELGARGMQVVVADIDFVGAERVTAGIEGASAIKLDVRDEAGWVAALDLAEARHGPLAVLVSNAGVMGSTTPFTETPLYAWEWSRSVSLDGAFYGLTHGARRILAAGTPGHIIATSSMSIFSPTARTGVYAAMKAGVAVLCEALRDEMSDRPIGVSVLVPGAVRTNILESNASRSPDGRPVGENLDELTEMLRNGLDPAQVAKQVADALGTDKFWLFTHPELEHRIDTLFAEMKAALHGN